MALFRKFFYRKPPDGLLEISERLYVFDSCFTTDVLEEDEYKVYMAGIVSQLHDHFPDASFMVFNFREGENQSQVSTILSEYDMTVMDYPRHYESCPILTMEMVHHFLRSSESWLSLGQQNVLLMHCERGGWPVLAFMLAALLIYRKQYNGEQKTLDMIYKQAPRELLQLMSPLYPLPSQLRYLQYVSTRNCGSEWPPMDRALTLDCVILRVIPNFDGEGGCCPIFRIYGQDPFMAADRTPKILFSMPKRSKTVRHYKQEDCGLVKIDINCHIQGDVVLECISLDDDLEHEQMMFRVMFNTAFLRSNILMLNRDEIDILWNAKDQFPKDFRAEVLFSEMDVASSLVTINCPFTEGKEGLPVEAFAKVQEIFSNVDWLDPKSDAAIDVLQKITDLQEKLETDSLCSVVCKVENEKVLQESILEIIKEKAESKAWEENIKIPASVTQESKVEPSIEPSLETDSSKKETEPQELQAALQWSALPKIISQRMPRSSLSNPVSYCNSLNGSPTPISRYHSAPSILGITALLHDHATSKSEEVTRLTLSSPSLTTFSPISPLPKPLRPMTVSSPPPLPHTSSQPLDVVPTTVEKAPTRRTPPPNTPGHLLSLKSTHSTVDQPLDTSLHRGGQLTPSPPLLPYAPSPSVKSSAPTVSAPSLPPPPPPPPPYPYPSVNVSFSPTIENSIPICPPPPPPTPPAPPPSFPGASASPTMKNSLSMPPLPPPLPPGIASSTISTGLSQISKSTVTVGPPPSPPPPLCSGSPSANTVVSSAPPPPPPPSFPPKDPVLRNSLHVPLVPPPPPPICSGPASANNALSSAPPPPPPPRFAPKDPASRNSPQVPPVPPPPGPLSQGLSKAGGVTLQSHSAISNGNVPPTPAPPLIVKGRIQARPLARNQGQAKKTNLKPYHWLKLTRAMQGSLWAEAQKPDEASKAPEFDMTELESLFSTAGPNSDKSSTGGRAGGLASGPKSEKIHLIELRRAYNCEIMLTKVKVPLPDLMNSVLVLDDLALDVDQVDNLIKFCPTKEEMELLKGYKGDQEKLGKCEQFFLELMKVPRVESKLRVFSFKIQFRSQVSDLRNSLSIVNSAAEEIRNSVKLKRIMQTILSLGNALNHGTARGSAIGFRLDSLLKLTDTRARNNKMTLMHYLCKVLSEKLPELLDFSKDLVSLEASTKIQLKYLAEEMQAISKGLEKVAQELSASENDGPVSDNFCKILKEFLSSAEAEVRSLASLYSGVGRNADALANYFGEDPAKCPFEQVVSTLLNFVRMFARAHEDNCKQLELEKKKAEKEAESEKKKEQEEAESKKIKMGSPRKGSERRTELEKKKAHDKMKIDSSRTESIHSPITSATTN